MKIAHLSLTRFANCEMLLSKSVSGCCILFPWWFRRFSSPTDTDRDFDPTAEMMVHEFDDEQTLDEEEAMSNESTGNELDDLEKVSAVESSDLQIVVSRAFQTTRGEERHCLLSIQSSRAHCCEK